MTPKLYMTALSPPVRAVLMCARAIDLELDLIEIDILKGDQLKPEYVKINPLHTVPTLDDDSLILIDSHAIMSFLVGKYAKDKSLYPEDVTRRVLIDQKLYFDSSVLFARHIRIAGQLLRGRKTIPIDLADDVREAYGYLETFLTDNTFVAGNTLSIADLSIVSTLTNASVLVPLDQYKYPNISTWKKRLENVPYCNINKTEEVALRHLVQSMLSD